jgi:microcystin-dependent protein
LDVYAASNANTNVNMSPFALGLAGNNLPHNNLSPFQCLTFIIALQGIFPPRS